MNWVLETDKKRRMVAGQNGQNRIFRVDVQNRIFRLVVDGNRIFRVNKRHEMNKIPFLIRS
jgi:hypothetical protein